MDASAKYGYILPKLTTEEYCLLAFALNKCKDDVSYGFRIKPLIKKIQNKVMVSAFDPAGKETANGE